MPKGQGQEQIGPEVNAAVLNVLTQNAQRSSLLDVTQALDIQLVNMGTQTAKTADLFQAKISHIELYEI